LEDQTIGGADVRGKTTFLALVAGLVMLCAATVAFAHEQVGIPGTKDSDELTMGDGSNKVYARGGDDTVDGGGGNDRLRGGRGDDTLLGGAGSDKLKGGQDNDYLDGGPGNDVINARGDGRDGDEVACGTGEDTVLLGRKDELVAGVEASELSDGVETEDGGCEHVKYPKGTAPKEDVCAAHASGCDDQSLPDPCVARLVPSCGDPDVVKPDEPVDEPVEEPEPDTP
jgi:hypothetical protein